MPPHTASEIQRLSNELLNLASRAPAIKAAEVAATEELRRARGLGSRGGLQGSVGGQRGREALWTARRERMEGLMSSHARWLESFADELRAG